MLNKGCVLVDDFSFLLVTCHLLGKM
jgi:hypothetical protein